MSTDNPVLPEPIPEPPKLKTLAQKILEIQAAVGAVKKRGKFGTELGGSSYLRIEDAVSAVGKLMTDRGLILTGTLQTKPDGTYYYDRVAGTNKGYMTTLVMQWILTDVDTTECQSWSTPGEGYDGTDKGTPKAQTSSRKYAIINIFNLAVGNDIEAHTVSFDEARTKQKAVANKTLAEKANSDNPKVRQIAVDALSQVEPERRILISRPEGFNGHYIAVSGLVAVPQLEQYFMDTESKRFQSKTDKSVYWRVPVEYEKGLIDLCLKLSIELEG